MNGADAAAPAVVPAPVQAFLTQLAVALHKTRTYPPGHPMRDGAVRAAHEALQRACLPGMPLYVGVTRQQLLVDGAATDPGHYVLRDLARRLSRLHVGGILVSANAGEDDLAQAVAALAADAGREAPPDQPRVWRGVELLPVAYDALALDRAEPDDDDDGAEALWRELAWRALTGNGLEAEAEPEPASDGPNRRGGATARGRRAPPELARLAPVRPPPGAGPGAGPGIDEILLAGSDSLARALVERLEHPETRAAVAQAIERTARTANALDPDTRRTIEIKLRHLLASLPRESLTLLLDIDAGRREDLAKAEAAAEWLPIPALLDLLDTAARARGQEISTSLLRMLRKLAANADPETGDVTADTDLRAVLRELFHAWSLDSPNPWHHTLILETLARFEREGDAGELHPSEGLRLVQIALETGTGGPQLAEAVDLAVDEGDLGPMVRLLDGPAGESEPGRQVWALLVAPATLRRLLRGKAGDVLALERVLARAGEEALDALLDGALGSGDRAVQGAALQRVLALGPAGVSALVRRLPGSSIATVRSVLGILAELPELPEGVSFRSYATSAEPLVRLEAYRLMLRVPAERQEAIHAALVDPDERVVRLAVEAGGESFPRSSLTRLMLLLNSPGRSVELRARGVALLAHFDTAYVRQWLLEGMVVRRGWLFRKRLAAKSPMLLAKLAVLARRWSTWPEAERVLRLARASGDSELIAACGDGGGG